MTRRRMRPQAIWLGIALALAACTTTSDPATTPGTSAAPITTAPNATAPPATIPQPSSTTTAVAPTTTAGPPSTTTTAVTTTTVPPTGDPTLGIVVLAALIDGTGADPIPDGAIVIQGDTIVAVGARDQVKTPGGALVYDLPGATILPGFINTHVHNAYDVANLRTWATSGVTTVRDVGARWEGDAEALFFVRDRLAEFPDTARLLAAGPLVTVPGGYPIAGLYFPSLTVTSPEDARHQAGMLVEAGADVIKITLTVGGPPTLSVEEVAAIVAVAHQAGIPVTAHVTDQESMEVGLAGGIDEAAHSVGGHFSDGTLQRMLDRDVSWVTTQAIQEGYGARNMIRFLLAGGRVVMGNDAGWLPGVMIGMPMNEIRALEAARMTPMQIIVASTRDAAYACRVDDLVGTLETGKIADVLVLQGDPLADLGVLEDVALVIHNGVVINDGG